MKREPAHLRRGREAEARACHYLQRQGLRLVERNFRSRLGEVDLIMDDGGALVFVEVRYRAHPAFGSGAESIDVRKRRRVISAAQIYLQRTGSENRACRFDVVSVGGETLDWTRNAFDGSGAV